MRTRRSVLSLMSVAAIAAVGLPLAATSAPTLELPDLRADAPENPRLETNGGRLLMRFDGFVTNIGQGPLDINGNPAAGAMVQRARTAEGNFVDVTSTEVKYETADGHNHWHLMRASRYSLWRTDRSAEVAPGQKVGFCLYDIEEARNAPTRDPKFYDGDGTFCDQGDRGSTELRMGVSAGWRDVYYANLGLQWVDVSETVPGSYLLAAEADPNDHIRESNENNPIAFRSQAVTVPGYLAQNVGPVAVAGRATTVNLAATTVGAPGPRVYKVESAPANGTLNVPVGGTTSGAVTYTPSPGYTGSDSFRFSARDNSGFPRNPTQATATLQVGARQAVSVAISGAPASMIAGTGVQLTAAVVNGASGVTWSIVGDPGNGSLGSVSAQGLYLAPAGVPAPGSVTVRATSVDDPAVTSEVAIAIAPVPAQIPAPSPLGPRAAAPVSRETPTERRFTQDAAGQPALTRARVSRSRNGRVLVVRVAARRPGTLNIAARRGGTRADQCVVRLSRGRGVTCTLRLKRALARQPVRVVVILKATDGTRSLRRALVR